MQGIEAALRRGAAEQRHRHVVAVHGAGEVPVGVELGVDEGVEHLADGGALGGAAMGVEMELGADHVDIAAPAGMRCFVVAVGAVDIGERFPALHDATEIIEAQHLGLADKDFLGVDQPLAAARVGTGPRQLADLGHTDSAGRQRLVTRLQVVEQLDRAQTAVAST